MTGRKIGGYTVEELATLMRVEVRDANMKIALLRREIAHRESELAKLTARVEELDAAEALLEW